MEIAIGDAFDFSVLPTDSVYHDLIESPKREFDPFSFSSSTSPSKRIKTEDVDPTDEQKMVLLSEGNLIFIQAYAGTGKTTTLYLYTKSRPSTRFLYLAFNRSSKDNAEIKFADNVVCRTIDSLCFEIANSRGKSVEPMYPITFKKYCPELGSDPKLLWKIHELLKIFVESVDYQSVDAAWKDHQRLGGDAYNAASKLWGQIYQGTSTWTCHEFNRKIALLRKNGQLAREYLESNFDCIMVDECQDLNAVMLAILKKYTKQKIFVGDTHQAIYSFMGNVNAFHRLRPTDIFHLTQSFRFSETIADRANWIVRVLKNVPHNESQRLIPSTLIRGLGHPTEFVSIEDHQDKYTLLSRVNKNLFYHAENVTNNGKTICWNGKDDFFKKVEQTMKIFENPQAWKIKRQTAIEDRDIETKSMMDLIEEYEPEKLKQVMKKMQSHMTSEENADVVLSTVHKAKGLEWDHVIIHADIGNSIIRAFADEEFDISKYMEECNIYYVALTRSKIKVDDRAHKIVYVLDENVPS